MLVGINDLDIRRDVLSTEDILSKSTSEIVSLVEVKEMGRNATDESASISAVSSFRRLKKSNTESNVPDRSKQILCPSCSKLFSLYRKRRNGWNAKPFKMCLDCWRAKSNSSTNVQSLDANSNEIIQQEAQVSAFDTSDDIVLNSMILIKGELRESRIVKAHPRANFRLTMKKTNRSVSVDGIADTGAQSNLWGWDDFVNAGFNKKDLQSVHIKIRAANKHPINVIGAFKAVFSGMSPDNKLISCEDVVYVSDSVSGFFLSYATMVELLIINKRFPRIGSCVTPMSRRAMGTRDCAINLN